MFGIYKGDTLLHLTETEAAANIVAAEHPEAKSLQVTPITVTKPLDPTPWEGRKGTRHATVTQMQRGIYWSPAGGFQRDSAKYASQGGLDPHPYFLPAPEGKIIMGRTRFAKRDNYTPKDVIFQPREGFIQEEANYLPVED